ncbi:MAG: hypothetical protein LBL86_04780 [Coriobacteriales bacterium]|nr:hypothetical protein [Coriobacteriales bacterium]
MKKKIAIFAIVGILLFGGAIPAFAGNADFNLLIQQGGIESHTATNAKDDSEGRWYVTPLSSLGSASSDWNTGEAVYFRAQNFAGAALSDTVGLIKNGNGPNGFFGTYNVHAYQWYWSSLSVGANYVVKMAGYKNSDSFGALRMVGRWCP